MKLPKSWKQITLSQYARIGEILENENATAIDKDIDVISFLSGKTYREVLELTMAEKRSALQGIQFLNTLGTIPLHKKKYFGIGGKLFRISYDMREITGGQYIDLMEFLKNPADNLKNLHNVLAVIALPMRFGIYRRKYDGAAHAARAKLFYEGLDIATVYPIMVFFCKLLKVSISVMEAFLKSQTANLTEMLSQKAEPTSNNTDGSLPLTS